jgi:Fic-DOC domain mobile mystery protein B
MTSPWTPIPGETPIDISGLKIKGIGTRGELNVFEAENINKVVLKYLATKPTRRSASFDYSWVLKLHKEMFGDVWKWAGKTRQEDLNFGVRWTQVQSMLMTLLGDLSFWEANNSMGLLEQAMYLHHRAVQIHPFQNGNGRWSRMLANIWLKLHDHPITLWPEKAVEETSEVRNEYLSAIKQADAGRYGEFLSLHQRYTAPIHDTSSS